MFRLPWPDEETRKVLAWYGAGVAGLVGVIFILLQIYASIHRTPHPDTQAPVHLPQPSGAVATRIAREEQQALGCDSSMSIAISFPLDRETITLSNSAANRIGGRATHSETCRYVYVLVRDLRSG